MTSENRTQQNPVIPWVPLDCGSLIKHTVVTNHGKTLCTHLIHQATRVLMAENDKTANLNSEPRPLPIRHEHVGSHLVQDRGGSWIHTALSWAQFSHPNPHNFLPVGSSRNDFTTKWQTTSIRDILKHAPFSTQRKSSPNTTKPRIWRTYWVEQQHMNIVKHIEYIHTTENLCQQTIHMASKENATLFHWAAIKNRIGLFRFKRCHCG